jgi:hypothetical protein
MLANPLPVQDPMLDLQNLKCHVERHPEQHQHFSFTVKFEHVMQRTVLRSLNYEDDVNPACTWGIRCVPLGHTALFYLLRNSLMEYMEFEYDYTIVNGDGQFETGYGRRGFINAHTLCDEFLGPAIDIPVHPNRNWFILQINIRHLRRNRDYWFIQPSVPSIRHPLNQQHQNGDVLDNILEHDIINLELEEAAILKPQPLRHLSDDIPTFPSFSKRLLSLFVDETFSDCEIKAGNSVFPAHKSLLAAHSIVLRSMFIHSCTLESQTSCLKIDYLLPEAVLVMLQWFYTGELGALDNDVAAAYLPLSDRISNTIENSDDPTSSEFPIKKPQRLDTEVVIDVVQLAHKYDLQDLIYLSEQILVNRMDLSNCCRLAYLSSLFQLFSLKMASFAMIKENREKVLKSEQWKDLIDTDAELAKSIFEGY